MAKHVYIKTSKDRFRFIEAMADTGAELAAMVGVHKDTVYSSVCLGKPGYEKVILPDDEEEENGTQN